MEGGHYVRREDRDTREGYFIEGGHCVRREGYLREVESPG